MGWTSRLEAITARAIFGAGEGSVKLRCGQVTEGGAHAPGGKGPHDGAQALEQAAARPRDAGLRGANRSAWRAPHHRSGPPPVRASWSTPFSSRRPASERRTGAREGAARSRRRPPLTGSPRHRKIPDSVLACSHHLARVPGCPSCIRRKLESFDLVPRESGSPAAHAAPTSPIEVALLRMTMVALFQEGDDVAVRTGTLEELLEERQVVGGEFVEVTHPTPGLLRVAPFQFHVLVR